jgi:hypothetical protein
MTDATLCQLAGSCPLLQGVDLHRCAAVTCAALQRLVASCPQLRKLVLPPQLQLSALLPALPCCARLADDDGGAQHAEQLRRHTLHLHRA